MRRLTLNAWITLGVVSAAALFVFSQLEPSLLFRNTTPAGGDTGAHVWAPAYLRDHLLPNGRLSGWSQDWYAGFPALFFYFPLPMLLIVALATVLPYGIAFKLVTVIGMVTLPIAAWAMGRLLNLKDPVPACLAAATLPFLFDRSFTIYGGNIASTLAGEFAFSISLSVALLFFGVFGRALQTGRHRGLSALLLAVCALCHVVPAFFAIAGALILAAMRWHRRAFVHVWWTFAVSGLLAAFWVVPFLLRMPYVNDMGWEKEVKYRSMLFNPDMHWLHYLALASAILAVVLRRRGGLFLIGLAAASALAYRFMPDGRLWNNRVFPFWQLSLYLLSGLGLAEFGRLAVVGIRSLYAPDPWLARTEVGAVDANELGADENDDFLWPGVPSEEPQPAEPVDRGPDWGALVVPVVVLGMALWWVAGPLQLVTGALHPADHTKSFLPDWARWNYSGYEGKPAYPEYYDVVTTMGRVGRDHGCGRAMWEYEPELDRLGTPMALMLMPHWTDRCIGSMEGLYFESSATVPYHFLNQAELSWKPSSPQSDLPYRRMSGDKDQRAAVLAQGVRHLQYMGVRYYMTISPEVQELAREHPDLELVATSGPWSVTYNRPGELTGVHERTWEVYRVHDAELVVPLDNLPAVMQGVPKGGDEWQAAAVKWYEDESRRDVPYAASGPEAWPRVENWPPPPTTENPPPPPPRIPVQGADTVEIANVRTDNDRIEFDVSKPGTPVLVKASYFPNWQAKGAEGPWRVTPNLMVVVPTSTHVSMRYGQTPVDLIGWGLTVMGVVALVWLARRRPLDFR